MLYYELACSVASRDCELVWIVYMDCVFRQHLRAIPAQRRAPPSDFGLWDRVSVPHGPGAPEAGGHLLLVHAARRPEGGQADDRERQRQNSEKVF